MELKTLNIDTNWRQNRQNICILIKENKSTKKQTNNKSIRAPLTGAP